MNTWPRPDNRKRLTVLVPWVALAVAAAGCGGKSNTYNVECAPGSVIQGDECVAVPSEGGIDATASDGANGVDAPFLPDVSTLDGGADVGAPADGSIETSDGEVNDAAVDVETGTADPCPVDTNPPFLFYDCDPACLGADASSELAACQNATCASDVPLNVEMPQINELTPSIIKTPDRPAADPTCAVGCTTATIDYGIAVTLSKGILPYTVSVEPPWYVLEATSTIPFCPYNTNLQQDGCVLFDGTIPETVYIVTNEDNAPSRNVQIQYANSCP